MRFASQERFDDVRAGWVVKVSLCSTGLTSQQAVAAPVPNHRRRSMENGSYFSGSQQSGFSQSLSAAFNTVLAHCGMDTRRVEGMVEPSAQPARIQYGCDFRLRVVLQ